MNEQILEIIIRIAALLVLYLGIIVCNKLKQLINQKLTAGEKEALDVFVGELTKAAEQMFKSEDDDGSQRLSYVQSMLIQAGYDLTDEVRAMIEAHVFEINKGNKIQ